MSELLALAIILFLAIVAPIIVVLHFVTKWKQSREISTDDEQLLEDLWMLSQRLEERLMTLEEILVEDVPDGRRKI